MLSSSKAGARVSQHARCVLLMVHMRRRDAATVATDLAKRLLKAEIGVRLVSEGPHLPEIIEAGAHVVPSDEQAAQGCRAVIGVGGDGTLLHAAEYARPMQVPLLGVNVGRVGFLADSEPEDLERIVTAVREGSLSIDPRQTLAVQVQHDGREIASTWALNEASVEKGARERILDLLIEVDERPLAHWGCDGLVCATPTGSTAYSYSAGGPVVWPGVQAMLLVPISAHALFARPMVVAPTSRIVAHVVGPHDVNAVLWCDGRRTVTVPVGAQVQVERSQQPVLLARLDNGPFTDRLVEKFHLPVQGWRSLNAHD